ncbi:MULTISPECIES: hypothetical protein [Niastella]|uniref:Bacteroidetes PKD-like domain-containing protein n=1 Tax=Niastella soli TaxID=2821487 RepID=A0ABS3Z1K0_9BACT|nr:hypothetical protein [Niastella soli]MBO9203545.1 hypothetical protein [Niastella soli]
MKRMVLFSTLFLCLSVVSFTSCKKEKASPTQAELTANELQAFIQSNGVKRIIPVQINTPFSIPYPVRQGIVWHFSNGYIYFDNDLVNQAYNLSYVVHFNTANVPITNGTTETVLILYMEHL